MLISQESHCALIIVIELAVHYESTGVSLEEIASLHHIPLETLTSVANQLCAAGLLTSKTTKGHQLRYHLTREPQELFALDVVQIFDGEIFDGRFMDHTTGKWKPESKAARLINMERKHYLNYLRRKLKKVNIGRWGEMLERSSYNTL